MVFVNDLLIGLLSSLKEPLREKKKKPRKSKNVESFFCFACGNIP
jgi:hypothetical protein